jgi:hypothetical protein
MISGVFGDLAEKFIQGSSHIFYCQSILLPLTFLFKDEAGEMGAQEIYGWFIELFREDFGVEICWVREI